MPEMEVVVACGAGARLGAGEGGLGEGLQEERGAAGGAGGAGGRAVGGCGVGGGAGGGHDLLERGCVCVRGVGSPGGIRGQRGRFVAAVSAWGVGVGGGVLRLGRGAEGSARCGIAGAVDVASEGRGVVRGHC